MDSPRKGNPKQIFSKANLVVLHSPAACPLEGEVVVKRSTWRQAGRGAGGSSGWGWGGPALEGVLILEWLRAGPAPEWLGVQALFSHAHPKSGPPPAMLESPFHTHSWAGCSRARVSFPCAGFTCVVPVPSLE